MVTKSQLEAENDALRALVAGKDHVEVCVGLARDKVTADNRAREMALETAELRSGERTSEANLLALQRLRAFAQSVVDHHLGEGFSSAVTNVEDGSIADLRSLCRVYARHRRRMQGAQIPEVSD